MKDTVAYEDRWQRIPFKAVSELLEAGKTYQEIAEVFGISALKARKWCWRARSEGYAAKKAKAELSGWHYVENRYRRQGTAARGSMEKVLGPLDRCILDWLIEQTPEGASIADTVRAIITDAYHDEHP